MDFVIFKLRIVVINLSYDIFMFVNGVIFVLVVINFLEIVLILYVVFE